MSAAGPALLAPRWRASVDAYPLALALSHDGAVVLTLLGEGALLAAQASDGAPAFSVDAHAQGALCMAVHPSEALVATGGQDGFVRLWSARDGEALGAFECKRGAWVEHLRFSPDGALLVASAGKTVHGLVGAAGLERRFESAPHASTVSGLCFAPDGALFASAFHGGVRLLRAADGALERTLEQKTTFRTPTWNPRRPVLAATTQERALVLFDLANPEATPLTSRCPFKPLAPAWDASGALLAVAGHHSVVGFDYEALTPKGGPKGLLLAQHTTKVTALAWHPSEARLASGSVEGRLAVWAPREGPTPTHASGLRGETTALVWTPDGATLFATSAEGHLAAFALA